MKYLQMVHDAPNKSEQIMWRSVEDISEFLDKIEDKVPDLVRDFMLREYEIMFGPHFNESMAREEVSKMHHRANDGANIVGEIFSPEEAMTIVPDGCDDDCAWDAYVGANGMAHDIARVGLDRMAVLDAARQFWFEDDDFSADTSKVWWYYKNK